MAMPPVGCSVVPPSHSAPSRPRTLSKSDYTLARSCDAKLYFRENGYPDDRESDPYLQLLAYGGYMVDALAKANRPHGIALEYGRDTAADCERTRELLTREDVTLFEGTLLIGRRLARADIIEKRGNVVHLIEVKSKSIDGAAHAERIRSGGPGLFRRAKQPGVIVEEWREKLEDITYQVLLLERMVPNVVIKPALILVDKSKRSALDNVPGLFRIITRPGRDGRERLHSAEFIGEAEQLAALDLLTEFDVSGEVELLRDEVEEAAARFEEMLDEPFHAEWASHGSKCAGCEFRDDDPAIESGFALCWGALATAQPHVLELFSVGTVKAADGTRLVASMVAAGLGSLFDVPQACLVKKDGTRGPQAERQVRQIEHTRIGTQWIGPALRTKVAAVTYPLHFIDFEGSRLALPYHAGMRPWGQVAFQWSCHTVEVPGAKPVHREWLNIDDVWPNKSFALSLREVVGDTGSVLTWSQYENAAIRGIISDLPTFAPRDAELEAWLASVAGRSVDLHPWANNDYYHPGMRGKTSIKVVLDALWRADPAMRAQFEAWTGWRVSEDADPYAALPDIAINGVRQDVREGVGAMRAYEAMMYGVEKDDVVAKEAWRRLLQQYCELDTMSMVLIFEYWRRATADSGDRPALY